MRFFVYLIVAASFFSPLSLVANQNQDTISGANTASVEKIKAESLHSKVMDIAFHLTDIAGPRLTISPGFTRAADWAITQLGSYGLENARLEPWGDFGKGWYQEKCYVAMTFPYYNPIIAMPKAWTGSTPGKGTIEGNVILVNATDSASFALNYSGKLNGKMVLFFVNDSLRPSFEADANRFTDEALEKMANAEPVNPGNISRDPGRLQRIRAYFQARMIRNLVNAENPALIIDYGGGTDGTIFVQGGGSQAAGTKDAPATVVISSDEYLRMQRLLMAGIPVKIAAEVRTKSYMDDPKGYNVIAEIPGTDPILKDEFVMAGAHLDSWHASTGATDNAAGCAIMMEAARLIIAAGLQPRRTIRIALWSGEEQGLLGSKGWVKNNLADPAGMVLQPAHDKISAYFNLDNGGGRIRGIYCQGNLDVIPIFQEWLNNFGDPAAKTVTINNTGGTDHLSFDEVGIPGFQFIQDELEYRTRTHHTNMDSFDHLVPGDMIQASTIVASFLFNAAQRDEKLPRKALPKPAGNSRN